MGDGNRFEHAGQVSNYLGLAPRVDISGTLVMSRNSRALLAAAAAPPGRIPPVAR
ncbi:MAG: transposase [Treponema sp.]|nr:transposase [Treponema sp.]